MPEAAFSPAMSAEASLASAEMTFPSASSPLLMLTPSLKVAPSAWVLFTRSLPARSTRFIFPLSTSTPAPAEDSAGLLAVSVSTDTVKMAWDRLDCLFMPVLDVLRSFTPYLFQSRPRDQETKSGDGLVSVSVRRNNQ